MRPVMQHFWSDGSPCECPESKCVTLHSNMEIKWKMENCNQKNIFICRNRKTIIKGNIHFSLYSMAYSYISSYKLNYLSFKFLSVTIEIGCNLCCFLTSRNAFRSKRSTCSYNIHHSDICDFTCDTGRCIGSMEGNAQKCVLVSQKMPE